MLARTRGKIVRGKWILVREKSVKTQGISFQTKSGNPEDCPGLILTEIPIFFHAYHLNNVGSVIVCCPLFSNKFVCSNGVSKKLNFMALQKDWKYCHGTFAKVYIFFKKRWMLRKYNLTLVTDGCLRWHQHKLQISHWEWHQNLLA